MKASVEDMNLILIDENMLREALGWVSGCERCAGYAAISFDYLLDAITGADPQYTEYLLCRPAQCPGCSAEITEKTQIAVC